MTPGSQIFDPVRLESTKVTFQFNCMQLGPTGSDPSLRHFRHWVSDIRPSSFIASRTETIQKHWTTFVASIDKNTIDLKLELNIDLDGRVAEIVATSFIARNIHRHESPDYQLINTVLELSFFHIIMQYCGFYSIFIINHVLQWTMIKCDLRFMQKSSTVSQCVWFTINLISRF